MSVQRRVPFWLLISIPPLVFYFLLFKSLKGLPVSDDYGAVLGFLLKWKSESGTQHLVQVLMSQNNDYRLMFENAFYGIQYEILGQTNLRALAILGDLFVIPLFGVLYLIWRECGRPRDYALLAFLPVSWILFQFQYASALDNASAPLQLIPVIVFALLTCLLANKVGTPAFMGTLLSLLLCIASSGNGLFMVPIGALIYLQRKEYKKLVTWFCVSALACLVYFHGYDFSVEMSHTHMNNNVLSVLSHLSPAYGAAFLGSIAAVANPLPAILFGALLTGVFIFATYDRLYVRNPALFYSALFFFVTSAAVSGLRSSLGLTTALGSRYRINSTVLVILLYLYLADKFCGINVRPLILKAGAAALALLLVTFNVASNLAGLKLILTMQQKVEVAMLQWVRHEPDPPVPPSSPHDFTINCEKKGYFKPSEPIFSESIREGIYVLPELPIRN